MNFNRKYIGFIVGLCSLMLVQCTKKNNLDIKEWITREAGAYDITQIETLKYEDESLIQDSITLSLESTFLLRSQEGEDGTTYFVLNLYGSYLPDFLDRPRDGFTWVTEQDNLRLTFGIIDPNYGPQATASLTVDNMGKKSQKWHYIQNYIQGGKNIYIHRIYSAERRNQ